MRRASTFPAFLGPSFDEQTLAAEASSIAIIDREGEILWVNPAWHRFASENGAVGESVKWKSYFASISQELRPYYRRSFESALESGTPFEQDYECSSPEQRRFYRLRALPVDGCGLLITHDLVSIAPHDEPNHPAFEAGYRNPSGIIEQCSNCRRVRKPGANQWHWIAKWVSDPLPLTSHGICPLCVGFYWGDV